MTIYCEAPRRGVTRVPHLLDRNSTGGASRIEPTGSRSTDRMSGKANVLFVNRTSNFPPSATLKFPPCWLAKLSTECRLPVGQHRRAAVQRRHPGSARHRHPRAPSSTAPAQSPGATLIPPVPAFNIGGEDLGRFLDYYTLRLLDRPRDPVASRPRGGRAALGRSSAMRGSARPAESSTRTGTCSWTASRRSATAGSRVPPPCCHRLTRGRKGLSPPGIPWSNRAEMLERARAQRRRHG
jgi:hypothetical protein